MSTLSPVDLLKRIPLFRSLSETQANVLAQAAQKKLFKRNERIVENGQQTHSLFIILSGSARVTLVDDKGRELILAQLQAGDFIGEMSLLDNEPHSASVVADSVVDTLVFERAAFNHCMHENGALTVAIMRSFVERMRKANQKICDLALVGVYGRVYGRLKEMASPISPDNTVAVVKKFSRSVLAKEVGASREMVSRALKDFEKQGCIQQTQDGSILILGRAQILSA